jgi:rare lipoprotein A (peptidoglycan hydrolase)
VRHPGRNRRISRVLTGAALAAVTTCGCAVRPLPAIDSTSGGRAAGGEAPERSDRFQVGLASWYGVPHHGQPTASGEIFDMTRLTAAHRTLPLGTYLRVVNLENGRVVRVRVNDRGPYVDGRILDLSREAARVLDMEQRGVATVRLEVVAAE